MSEIILFLLVMLAGQQIVGGWKLDLYFDSSIIVEMTNRLEEIASLLKALSNPNRLAIFEELCSCCVPGTECSLDEIGEYCVGDIGAKLNIAPSTLSHHLKELKHVGLIQTTRRGKRIDCRVDPEKLRLLHEYFGQWPLSKRNDANVCAAC